jgi:hypothetical protein
MNYRYLLLLVVPLACAGCRPPHAGKEAAQAALEKVLRESAEGELAALPLERSRTQSGTRVDDLWCVRGDFSVSFVDDLLGEYQFEVKYPATKSKLAVYMREGGWLRRKYTVSDLGRCEREKPSGS